MDFDYGIIGSGPAGYTSALLAAKLGKKVVVFEKDFIGGICLNKGCIPTKTILNTIELFEKIKSSQKIGLEVENAKINLQTLMERKNKVIELLRNGLLRSFSNAKIEFVNAEAKVVSENTIEANGKTYSCDKIIVATGSTPIIPSNIDIEHDFIKISDDVLNLETIPNKVVIIGSGAIGIEWSRIFSGMGCEVAIVELAPRLLPSADFEVSQRLERIFKQKKIKTYLSTNAEKIEDKKVFLSNGEVLEPDFILLAIGRKAIKPEVQGKVTYLGDVYGSIQLAHFAISQARAFILSENPIDGVFIPSVVYGNPEIAWIGACEQDLPPDSYEKNIVPISWLGKAHCDNDIEGFIKVLSVEGKIIGAHIISKEASALIQQFAIIMQNDMPIEDIKKVCFAHPTYSEGVLESVLPL